MFLFIWGSAHICDLGKLTVLLNNGWLDSGWTDPGHKIQPLSNVCPYSVQSLSNGGKSTGSVQSLSNWCRDPVQINHLWTKIGQENPALVHRLSNGASYIFANPFWHYLGLTHSGQKHDLMPLRLGSCLPLTVLGQCLDRYCTRQTLDKIQIQRPNLIPHTDIGHCLENYGIWTDSGVILDFTVRGRQEPKQSYIEYRFCPVSVLDLWAGNWRSVWKLSNPG